MAAWAEWEADVLAALQAPNTAANRKFLDAWHGYEGSTCGNNPLNTTEQWAGATLCNTVGVKNYRTNFDGAQATAATLRNGYYPHIVAALKSGDPYTYNNPTAMAAEIDKWGTHNFALTFTLATQTTTGGTTGTTGPPSGGGASTFLGGKSTSSLAGWNHLGSALAEKLPTDLHHARTVRRAALRELSGLRKVSK